MIIIFILDHISDLHLQQKAITSLLLFWFWDLMHDFGSRLYLSKREDY